MTSPTISLARTPLMRAVGGWLFQPLCAFAVVILLITAAARHDGTSLVEVLIAVVLFAIWARAATGYAEADGEALRWRCFLAHSRAWSEVDSIALHTRVIGLQGTQHVIRIRSGGHQRLLNPASGRNRAVAEFAGQLREFATARGIPVQFDSPDVPWNGLRAK